MTHAPLQERVGSVGALPALPAVAGGVPLVWRNAERADLPAIHALLSVSGRIDHPRDLVGLGELEVRFGALRFTAASDAVIGIAPDGSFVAYGEARLGETAETEVQVSLDGTVHPSLRRNGVGRALLEWQECRARQILADSSSRLPARMLVGSRVQCAGHLALYAAGGFAPTRWWLTLQRDLDAPVPAAPLPGACRVVPFTDRLSERVRGAFNDAFRDHWGSQPVSRAEWEGGVGLGEFSPELSRIVVERRPSGGDRVVAFALTEIDEGEWESNGGPFGYLEAIGVVRDRRGRGLSTAVIAAALHAYRERGLRSAVLDVDSDNPSGALGMYERLGFRTVDSSVTCSKVF